MKCSLSVAGSMCGLCIVMSVFAGCGGSGSKEPAPPPVPTAAAIVSISPSSVTAGSPDLTLTLTGSNFLANAIVNWNPAGATPTNLAATLANSTTITAVAPSTLLSAGGSAGVLVTNPGAPPSNAINFIVNFPVPSVSSITPATAQAGAA